MKIAETVTFGGGGRLDRAAHLRGPEDQARLVAADVALVIAIWRGKPLMDLADEDAPRLARLPVGHTVVKRHGDGLVFLGLDDGVPVFGADLSGWEPSDLPESLGAFLDPSQQMHPDLPHEMRFAELRAHMAMLGDADAELAVAAKSILSWHETHPFCSRCGAPSAISQAGWQRNCTTCNASHFPRTDPVVIMLITHGNDLLLGRSPGWPDGMYSLLAGFMEPGETIEAAVRREVAEETSVKVGPVRYLASQPWPFPSSLMIGCSGEALGREITLDPKELEDAIWVSRSELADVFAGHPGRIKAGRKGAIARFLMENWLADRLE